MQICIHRGAKEIGGSCVEVIFEGKRLIIDLGLPLDAEKNDKKYLPDISGWDGLDDSLLAILISHPHLDHFGLLAHISPRIPVIMGKDARRISNFSEMCVYWITATIPGKRFQFTLFENKLAKK